MMTNSHALEDKYNAEADAKKIAKHAAKEETQETSLEKLPTPTGWRILVCLLKLKKKLKAELLLHKKH